MDWGGKYVAVGTSGSNGYSIIDEVSYKLVRCVTRPSSVQSLKWNPDGNLLAIGDREVTILDSSMNFDSKCVINDVLTSRGTHKYRVTSLCWSPDGRFLAIGGSDSACLILESKGYTLVYELNHSNSITCLVWGQKRLKSGDCKRYLGVSDDSCKITLLKAGTETGEPVADNDDLSSNASTNFNSSAFNDWVLTNDTFRDIDETLMPPPRNTPEGAVTAVAFSRCRKRKSSIYLAYTAQDCSLTILTTRDWKMIFVSLPFCLMLE